MLLGVCFSGGIIFTAGKVIAGGIYVEDGANVNISGGILQDNDKAIVIEGGEHIISNVKISGSTNGAIYLTGGGTLTVKNCVIENNTNVGNGGAIYVGEGATLTLENTKILNNSTTGNGGAIYACANSVVQISGTTSITGNSGNFGGGIYLEEGALLNNGTAGIEYFAGNTSTANENIWQNVYYTKVDFNFELEGIVDSSRKEENYYGVDAKNILSFDVEGYNDYYTWLPYEGASDDQILNIDTLNDIEINKIDKLEGLGIAYYYGENKLSYPKYNDGTYGVKAKRSIISGNIVLQSTYNNLPVATIPAYAFRNIKTITGTLTMPNTITNIGSYAFSGCSGFTGKLVIPDSVTTIGGCVFENCSGFSGDLELPNSITFISNRAFSGCTGLTGTLTIGNRVTRIAEYAFHNCPRIKNVEIPNSVTQIDQYAFSVCYGLKGNLVIPENVKKIGIGAFYNCLGLSGIEFEKIMGWWIPSSIDATNKIWLNLKYPTTNITYLNNTYFRLAWERTEVLEYTLLDDNTYAVGMKNEYKSEYGGPLIIPTTYNELPVSTISSYAFQGGSKMVDTLTIPDSITSIGKYAFSGCSGFTGDLVIPSSITSIDDRAFEKCSGFSGTLTIGESVETIGKYAFISCTGFTGNLDFSNSLKSIGEYAFYGCASFNGTLNLGESVEQIGNRAFFNCKGFTNHLIIPDSVISVGNDAFAGCVGFNGNLVIGNGVKTIGNSAFYDCTGVNAITLGTSVITIGEYAFYNCNKVTGDLFVPDSVETIGQKAFARCVAINGKLTIGSGVTTIGAQAFYNNTSLTAIEYKGNIAISTYSSKPNIFEGVSRNLSVIIRSRCVPSYLFYQMTNITELTLHEPLLEIGDYAFSGCSGITAVGFVKGLTKIGGFAFENCTNLTVADIGERGENERCYYTLKTIDNCAFYNTKLTSFTIPYSLENFGVNVLAGTTKTTLTELNINSANESVLTVYMFADFSVLEKVNISSEIKNLPAGLFENCSRLKTIKTYNVGTEDCYNLVNIETFGNRTFANTGAVKVYADSLSNEGTEAFIGCKNLVYLRDIRYIFAKTAESLNWTIAQKTQSAFSSNYALVIPKTYVGFTVNTLADHAFANNTNLASVVLHNGITDIPYGAFSGCSRVVSVTIEGQILSIGEYGFYANSFTEFTLPKSCKTIADDAFRVCTKLETFTIPTDSQLTSIGGDAFYECTALKGITIPSKVVTIGTSAFERAFAQGSEVVFASGSNLTIGDNAFKLAKMSHINKTTVGGEEVSVLPSRLAVIGNRGFYQSEITGTLIINDGVQFMVGTQLDALNIDGDSIENGNALGYCFNLTAVVFGNGLIASSTRSIIPYRLLYNSTGVAKIVLPTTTNLKIGARSLARTALTIFNLPDNVVEIGRKAFADIGTLTQVNISENSSLQSIGDAAFENTGLTSFYIPESVTHIGKGVFFNEETSSLTSVEFNHIMGWWISADSAATSGDFIDVSNVQNNAENLITAPEYADYYWKKTEVLQFTKLTDGTYSVAMKNEFKSQYVGVLIIPDSYNGKAITQIADNAFNGCSGLYGDIDLTGKKYIGRNAFKSCTNLDITITSNCNWYISENENFVFFDINDKDYASELKNGNNTAWKYTNTLFKVTSTDNNVSYVVNSTLYPASNVYGTIVVPEVAGKNLEIGYHAFYSYSNLTTVKLPKNIISIAETAFYFAGSNMSKFSVVFAENTNNLEYIGNSAFAGSALESITLPTRTNNADLVIGNNVFSDCPNLKIVDIGDSATSVPESAFSSCPSLENVIIGKNVSVIGTYAFWGSFVENGYVTVKDGSNIVVNADAFYNCQFKGFSADDSTCATIPSRFSEIGDRAFKSSGLTGTLQFVSGNTTKFIDSEILSDEVFSNCQKLTSANLTNYAWSSNDYTLPNMFLYNSKGVVDVTLPSGGNLNLTLGSKSLSYTGVTSIESKDVDEVQEKAFRNCDSLISVNLSKIDTIGNSAFSNCDNLQSVNLGTMITNIGEEAFIECIKLDDIKIQGSINKIGARAFYGCLNLTIPYLSLNYAESVGESAFEGCNGITEMKFDYFSDTASFGNNAFKFKENADYTLTIRIYGEDEYSQYGWSEPDRYLECFAKYEFGNEYSNPLQYATNVYKNDTTTQITELYLQNYNNQYEVNNYAFYGATFLTSVTLDYGCTTIGDYAFSGCTGLESVVIPLSIKEIGSKSFYGCSINLHIWLGLAVNTSYNGYFQCGNVKMDFRINGEYGINPTHDLAQYLLNTENSYNGYWELKSN